MVCTGKEDNTNEKTLIFFISMFLIVSGHSVHAENDNLTASNISENQEEIIENSPIVEIKRVTSNGTETVVYTGALSGYNDEFLNGIDFSDIENMILFSWDSNDTLYISKTEENNNSLMMSTSGNLLSDSSDLSISSQIKINGVNVGEDGLRIIDNANMSCNFTVSNNSDTEKSVVALLATYSETGRLQNVETVQIGVDGNETENMQIVYQFNADTENTAKLMFWDSFSNMIPIKSTIDFSQTSGINAYYYNADNRLLQIDKMNGTSLVYTYDNMGNLLTRTIRE